MLSHSVVRHSSGTLRYRLLRSVYAQRGQVVQHVCVCVAGMYVCSVTISGSDNVWFVAFNSL